MGRGRQKAKHTKVARELKYFSPETNYSQLEKELGAGSPSSSAEHDAEAWAEYAEKYDSESDDER